MLRAYIGRHSPTILIINFHSSHNAGDAALLQAGIEQLRSSFNEPHIIVSANYPEEPYIHSLNVQVVPSFGALIGLNRGSLLFQIIFAFAGIVLAGIGALFPQICESKKFIPEGWRNLLSAYRKANLVIGCPGNQFFTMGRFGWPFIVSAINVFLAYLFRRPVYIMPQSLGPLKRAWERRLLKWLYTRARIVFVRETMSLQVARDLGLPHHKVVYAPDLAFGFLSVDRDAALALLKCLGFNRNTPSVGVTVITKMTRSLDEKSLTSYYSIMAQALSQMIEKYGVKIFFFPQVTGPTLHEDDRVAARLVLDQLKNVKQHAVLVNDPLSPTMLRSLYSFMDIFVATRMHSGIFALSMGVPTLFVGYLPKIQGILESLGLQEWLVKLDEIDNAHLWEKIEALWLQRHELKKILSEGIPIIAQQIDQVSKLIAQDYYGRK